MTSSTRLSLGIGIALLAGISCHDDSNVGPTDPAARESEPALATATTAAPAFAQTATTPPAFAVVSAGYLHSCGVATDSRAYCWGWNVHGQVGNGRTRYDQRTPALVVGGLRFRQISAGPYATCGVTTTNRAYCWGSNLTGTLGDGTTTDRLQPTPVAGGRFFRQVSVSGEYTCGVTTQDRAYCWGANAVGQLGNGTTDPSRIQTVPVAVVGGYLFREVSTGYQHSCGTTTTDRAYCWGRDDYGQIGDGSSHDICLYSFSRIPCRKIPTLVAGGYRFRQVVAGGGPGSFVETGADGGRSCGVTTDSRAFCWGDGSHGQLGNGTRSISTLPRRVSGSLQFRQVSTGEAAACGVTTSNRAYCWGYNYWGTIGDGTTTDRLTPTAVAGGLFFRQVSTGGSHTCGTTPGNAAYCWGSNGAGALGDGTTIVRRLRPRAVVGPM